MKHLPLLLAFLLSPLVKAQDSTHSAKPSPHADSSKSLNINVVQFALNVDTSHFHPKNIDAPRYFSINTDLMRYLILQPNIGIEFRRKILALGINCGIVLPFGLFTVNPLANGQYTWPA